jgi:asparagine synthase (glutamine-hydrolysing)
MVADVPLGAFLSGGVDSSTVVALMQLQSPLPVRTFSIGFHEAGYDEAPFARAIADHLGTEHTELYVTPAEAQAVVPRLPEIYDEPFSDSSQIPTLLISYLTRRHVTVSLSGDGGDEVFGGYARYLAAQALWRRLNRVPGGVRRGLGSGLAAAGVVYERGLNWRFDQAGKAGRWNAAAHRFQALSDAMAAASPEALYRDLVSHWKRPTAAVLGGYEPPTALTDPSRWTQLSDLAHRMMHLDTISYLPDDIFTKLDRASMAASLEARVPLLDHRVVEYAWRLPLSMKVRHGQGKWILREVLHRYVPRELIERPKKGFSVPIGAWLRGPLRDWAEALLEERRLRAEGFLDPAPVRIKWREHLSGRRNWQGYLWDVLMFQAWLERWGTGDPDQPRRAPRLQSTCDDCRVPVIQAR